MHSPFNIFLAGIGGTGIVTVNQVLGTAALRAGLHVQGLDQTGLSQKAGPVTSHLRISRTPTPTSNRVGLDSADCVLAFDLLTAADPKYVALASAQRTTTVASTSHTPTGAMVYDPNVAYPADAELLGRLEPVSRNTVTMDALAVSETLFGSTMVANFLLVGAAYQSGALPIPERFILDAIEFNGVAVAANVAAFRWGRVAVADPTAFAAATRTATVAPPTLAPDHPLLRNLTLTGDTAALAARRAAELIDYQGTSMAAEYLRRVQNVWQAERSVGEATAFSEAAARGLFKLAAYKDEYEVARLLTDPAFLETVHAEVPGGANLTYKLHPPTLKALGRDRKVGFGPRSHGVLRILKYGKRLRGTPLDPFGYTTMRRLERTLLAQYQSMLEEAAARLTADTYQRATSLAEAADLVRGYEDVKLRSVERYRARLQELGVDTVAF